MNKKVKAFANINLGDFRKEVEEKLTHNSQIKKKKNDTYQIKIFTKNYILKPKFASNKLKVIQLSNKGNFDKLEESKSENKLLAQLFSKEYGSPTLRNQITSPRTRPNWTHKWDLADKEITLYINSFTTGTAGHKFKSRIEITSPQESTQDEFYNIRSQF